MKVYACVIFNCTSTSLFINCNSQNMRYKWKFYFLLCPQDWRSRAYCFCPVCNSVWNFNLGNNFSNIKALALIVFHTSIPCDKIFSCIPIFFYPVTLTSEFGLLFENVNLAYNFSTVCARVFIFHMTIPYDKIFCWY